MTLLFSTLLLLLGACKVCSTELEGWVGFLPNKHGLYSMPNLASLTADQLCTIKWEGTISQLFSVDEFSSSPVALLLHSILALVRAQFNTGSDGQPESDYVELQKGLRLTEDFLNGNFHLKVDGLNAEKVGRLLDAGHSRVNGLVLNLFANERRKAMHSIPKHVPPFARDLKHFDLGWMQENLPKFRKDLLAKTLVQFALQTRQVLRELTGSAPSVRSFLHPDQIQELSTQRYFRLTLADDWQTNLSETSFEQLPKKPSDLVSMPADEGLEMHQFHVRIRLSRVCQIQSKIAEWPVLEGVAVDLQTLATVWAVTYLAVGARRAKLLENSDDVWLEVGPADFMVFLGDAGIRLEAYGVFREQLTGGEHGRLRAKLLALERSVRPPKRWDISQRVDTGSNLYIGEIRPAREPVHRRSGDDCVWLRQTAHQVDFTHESHAQMNQLLSGLRGNAPTWLLTWELRRWLLLVVSRAFRLLRREAAGERRLLGLGGTELYFELDDELAKEQSELARLFKEKDIDVSLRLVAEIAEEGCLQPHRVAQLLRALLNVQLDATDLLPTRTGWSLERRASTSQFSRTILFRSGGDTSRESADLPLWILEEFRDWFPPNDDHSQAEAPKVADWWNEVQAFWASKRAGSTSKRAEFNENALAVTVGKQTVEMSHEGVTPIRTKAELAFSLLMFGQLPLQLEDALQSSNPNLDHLKEVLFTGLGDIYA